MGIKCFSTNSEKQYDNNFCERFDIDFKPAQLFPSPHTICLLSGDGITIDTNNFTNWPVTSTTKKALG